MGAGISLVNVRAATDLITLECSICGGRLSTRTDQALPTSLAQLVDAISDHLAVNHPAEYYSQAAG